MPKLTNSFSSSLQFIILLLILHRFVSGATGPWYLKDYALSQGLPTSTLMDVGGNSTHLYAIEPEWFIHFFKSNATSGVFEYRSYWDSWDFDGAYRGDWSDDRTEIDLKIAINPFNSLVYIAKYVIKPTNSPRLIILGYNSYDIASQISMYTYNDPQYFGTAYANPRLKMAFDNNSNVYVCQYNDPRRSAKAGFFIAKMSPQLMPIKNITSVNEGALSISFFCHQSPIICVWTTSQSVTEYWMSNFTVYRNRSLNQPPITIGFNPKIVETTNGDFTYYLHHNVNQNTTVVLHKKNATHDPVPNEAAQLPYTMQLPPPEVYDMVRATNGDIIVGMMTAFYPPVGLGDRDVAVFRYSSTLELKSQFVFSTVLRDTISKLLLPNGDGNIIVVSGVTDGHPNLTLETSFVRRAFVVRFEYFEIAEVSTRIESYIQPGETINITFSSIPAAATVSVPVVLIDQQPCQVVRWIGSSLAATIPSGSGGPFNISVQFNYLSHSPSVKAYNFTYVPIPSLLDIQPRFGPAIGYPVVLNVGNIVTSDSSLLVFIGAQMCTDIVRVNASAITCRTPPGTGTNVSVVLSITGLVNSTETVNISYNPPEILQINPLVIPTTGAQLWVKGQNFGPCNQRPCLLSNIAITVGSFGSCNNGFHWNDTDLQCDAPEGFNVNSSVTIMAGGQSGSPGIVSYGKPVIASVSPSASISKNPTVIIEGSNFGNLTAPRDIIFRDTGTLQNYTCPTVTWISHQNIRCQFNTVDLPSSATLDITVIVGSQFNGFSGNSLFRTGITNNPPVAYPFNVTINEEQPVVLEFQASDPDLDDSVTIQITKNPSNGTLYQVGSNGDRGAFIDTISGSISVTNSMFRVLYIPNQDFNGNDTFNFKARDIWNADSSIQVAEVKVIAVPDSPIPQNRTYRMDEDTELLFTLETVDPDSPLSEQTVMILSLPTKGALFTPSVSNGSSWDQIRTIGDFFPRDSIFKYSTFPNLNGADSLIFAANDGYSNSTLNGTISFNVDPVNDPPILNITDLNLTVYEDTEALFLFDVFDVDGGDKLSVKITSVDISGALYSMDIQRGTKVLLGEGSEVRGPPYQFYYVPPLDYYTKENQTLQHFNITYTDGVINDLLSHRVVFSVLPVNDPPVVLCSIPEIFLPTNFIIGAFSNFSFYLQASDVDSSNITFVLTSPPRKGVLKTSQGRRLGVGSTFNDVQLTFDGERSGGGYPYSNFTVYAIDAENLTSQHCTYHFAFTCPPGLYNNIFSNGKGEICEPCPQGATCNTDGKIAPVPQYGWWKSGDNNTFLACFPMDACPGTAENTCGDGYRGVRCADCQQNFYRLGAVCRECRMMNIMPTVIAFVLFSGIVILFHLLQRSRVYRFGFALINILINFLQTIWVLRKVRLDWPPELLTVLDYFNVLNFNLEFVSPECIIQSPLNFSQKLRIILALPLVLLTVTMFLVIISTSVVSFSELVKKRHQNSTVQILNHKEKPGTTRVSFRVSVMKMFNASLSILYVHLAGKSLSLFDCTLEEDGKVYLDDEVSLVCYTDWWYQDLPFGVASIFVYVIGIPMYFGILCVFYYQTKARGEYWDKWKRISRGILHGDGDFKPEFQHFIILQLLQKLSIVAISIFFSRYTGLQIVLTIITLLASHTSYSKYNPYVHQTLNSLEKLSVLCSILVLAFGLPFRMDDFRFGNYRIGLVVIILCIIFGFIVGVLGVALNDVRKAISKRRMSWRQSTIKDQANS